MTLTRKLWIWLNNVLAQFLQNCWSENSTAFGIRHTPTSSARLLWRCISIVPKRTALCAHPFVPHYHIRQLCASGAPRSMDSLGSLERHLRYIVTYTGWWCLSGQARRLWCYSVTILAPLDPGGNRNRRGTKYWGPRAGVGFLAASPFSPATASGGVL